ncbi:MAG: ammonium transporter, partial [Proteobacteria bacterium SW_6_67_9]
VGFDRVRIDDPVGAISVHGVAGIWGLLAVPLSNDDASLGAQLLATCVIIAWVGITSAAVWAGLRATMGLRVSPEHEYDGVDVAECGLEAYPEFTASRGIAP